MKVTETRTRECCQDRDLRPVAGGPRVGVLAKVKFCQHCGRRHEYAAFTDAAGSMDWHYIPVRDRWEAA